MNLTSSQLADLKKMLARFYYHEGPERVGFIFGFNKLYEVQNVADNPLVGFYVGPKDVIRYTEEKKCWATWHTHPDQDANLSGNDARMFLQWPDMTHFIIGNDGVRAYKFDPEKKAVLQL